MDFRQYDNAIGRFNGMDALSEIMFSQTPYHFSYNNPIIFSDPSGLMAIGQGNSPVDTMWNQTAAGTSSLWRNDGGGFGNVTGSGYITYDNEYFGVKVELETVVVKKSNYSSGRLGAILQNHVYSKSPFYSHLKGNNSYDFNNIGNVLSIGGIIYDNLGDVVANKYGWIDAKGN